MPVYKHFANNSLKVETCVTVNGCFWCRKSKRLIQTFSLSGPT